VTAIGLACLSAFLFGAMSVGLRIGMNRYPDAELATVATVTGALAVSLVAMAAESPSRGVHAPPAWPFLLAGLMQPGVGQLFVTLSIREAGASRASVVLGSAPLASVTIALLLLGEPLRWPLVLGAVLIVGGGVELARERGRPAHVRRRGYLFAFLATILFSARDNLTRWLAGTTDVPPGTAAAAALAGGMLLILLVLGPRVRGRLELRPMLPFLGVGVLFGLSYVSLFEAYYRGRVTVVSPLVATESLWGVALSLLLIRHTELVGRRVLIGTALIVAGGALIGIYATG
jgi:drug/metabolite transporter (DMT)-like permease